MDIRLLSIGAALALSGAGAGAATANDGAAAERCETEVAETIKRMRGRDARDVQFVGAKRSVAPANEEEIGVAGEGRYAAPGGAVAFSYTCAFNPKSGATSGVLFREVGGPPQPALQADLTHVSPEACESATAAALKDRYPFVARIQFGSETRQLQPTSGTRVRLEGEGAVQRAPGMNAVPFRYRCEIDARTGRVVAVQADDRP